MRRAPLLILCLAACRFQPGPLAEGDGALDSAAGSDAPAGADGEPAGDAPPSIDGAIVDDAPVDAFVPPPPDAFFVPCEDAAAPSGYTVSMPGRPSCYRVDGDTEWWRDAQDDCDDDGNGTHLVVIDDLAENQFIHRIKTPGENIWVGISDQVDEGVYRWVTDQASTIMPLPWQGSPTGSSEDCAELRDADALWNDHDCFDNFNSSYQRRYVCEHDGVEPNPANY